MLKSILDIQNFILRRLIIKIIIRNEPSLRDYSLIREYGNAIFEI